MDGIKLMWQPWARIALRYGVGLVAGAAAGDALASDADIVDAVAAIMAVLAAGVTEMWYRRAKATGGET